MEKKQISMLVLDSLMKFAYITLTTRCDHQCQSLLETTDEEELQDLMSGSEEKLNGM